MPRLSQLLLFTGIFCLILGLMQWYQWRRYKSLYRRALSEPAFGRFRRWGNLVLWVANVMVAFQFSSRFVDWYAVPFLQVVLIYPAGVYLAAVVFGFFLTLLHDIPLVGAFLARYTIALAKRLADAGSTSVGTDVVNAPASDARRQFLKVSGAAMLGTTFGAPFIASLVTSHEYTVRRVPLTFPNLPSGLNGLTIAQISDVHCGVYMTEKQFFDIVEIVNGLHPNIIVHTGDHVDNADSQIPSIIAPTRALKADYGVFGVLGNHDHFATAEKVGAALEQTGLQLLNNANRQLTVNGEQFTVIGIDDYSRTNNFSNLAEAVLGVDPASFRLFLAHRPEFFDVARTQAEFDLMLSGHTHGGQIGFEAFGVKVYPVYLVQKYGMGYFAVEDKHLYVNVGVGMVGAPIRTVPAEISLFTLRSA